MRVVKVDVDANSDIAAEYDVQTIPTIALFRSGKWVAASVGAKRARVIESDLGLPGAGGTQAMAKCKVGISMHTSELALVPTVTTDQMRDIDDLVVNVFDITLMQMMENAGRSLAQLVADQQQPQGATVLVGPGHNGGGGLVAARHLFNRD